MPEPDIVQDFGLDPAGGREWQPMSTAPRDGTVIVARSVHAPHYHLIAYDPNPPTAWVAESGEYILLDSAELLAWSSLSDEASRAHSTRTRLARGLLLGAVALAGAGLLGMWFENAFDVLPNP
jgi:hypothetical protein